MGTYLVFFGKSQDFTSLYYDRNGWIADFNSLIRDFSLLESRVFTIDDINNKEILSRYFFTQQGKKYCLVKLYSLGQAMSGARISGSIYGVGLLSDRAIDFSKENLDLLRAAKDNFAKLSLDGIKFNKSNFKSDTDRIWNAIVSSKNGNLLDKISTQELKINEVEDPIAIFVKNLFEDAVELNSRIASFDTVYFSEDFQHLKRAQQKWGKDFFPIYSEENGKFVQYQEVVAAPIQTSKVVQAGTILKDQKVSEELTLRLELYDLKNANQSLKEDLEKIKKKQKRSRYLVYGLSGLVVVLLVILFFFDKIFPPPVVPPQPVAVSYPIDEILIDSTSREETANFLKNISFIYSFKIEKNSEDTTELMEKYFDISNYAYQYKLNVQPVNKVYNEHLAKLRASVPELADTVKRNQKK
jgi:hypothetical protein